MLFFFGTAYDCGEKGAKDVFKIPLENVNCLIYILHWTC